MSQLTVRVPDELASALQALPLEGDRNVSDNHRAALDLLVGIARLADLRARKSSRARSIERAKDDIGRGLLGVLPRETRDAFYTWAGCEDGEADVDCVLEWLAGGTQSDALEDFDDTDLLRAREIIARLLDHA